MPRTKEQIEEIRLDRKSQITRSAMELFAKEGYGHVSIAALAKHIGISKGLMYNYFDSKEQLLKEVIDYGIAEILKYVDPEQIDCLSSEEFILFIRKTFQIIREDKEFWIQFFSIIVQPNVSEFLRSSAMVEFMQQSFEMLETYFKDKGYEDPMLEVFQLSVIIEGLGVMMIYSKGLSNIPNELFEKFENRIINMYT